MEKIDEKLKDNPYRENEYAGGETRIKKIELEEGESKKKETIQ